MGQLFPKQSDLDTFGFDIVNDAGYFRPDLVENSCRADAGQVLSIRDSYTNLHLSLVLKVRSRLDAGEYDLVFQAISDQRLVEFDAPCEVRGRRSDFAAQNGAPDNGHQAVFTGISEVIEGVEKVIPSLVRIETPKQRLDFLGAIFAATPHAVVKIGSCPSERESGVVGIALSSAKTKSSEGGMIQGSPQMLNDFSGNDVPARGKSHGECELVDYVRFLSVKLRHVSWWIFIEEAFKVRYELIEQVLCPANPQFGTFKRINWQRNHGDKIRSNQRP
jgi:hypothetical protein